jgi:hypothetical protein
VQMSCGVERKSMRTLCTVQDRTARCLISPARTAGGRSVLIIPSNDPVTSRSHHRHNSVR